MRARIALWVGLALVLTSLAAAGSAQAYVAIASYGEPAFTNTTSNYYHWTWTNTSAGSSWWIHYNLYDGSSLAAGPYDSAVLSSNNSPHTGTYKVGFGGLQEGHYYGPCGTGYYSGGVTGVESSSSCTDANLNNLRSGSTQDYHPPAITVFVDGTATYTNNPVLQYHIDYADAISPPFAANFDCTGVGSPCGTTPNSLNYDAACSTPYSNNKTTYFECHQDAGSTPDGPIYFCAVAADSAIPDKPNDADQRQPASLANLSALSCGNVILDRTPPVVTPSANNTTVTVGDLVSFSSTVSDATSGVPNPLTWTFGDNTAAGSGASPTHSYTTAGTFVASLSTTDGAGNPGTGTVTITVKPVPPPRTTPNPPAGGGTPTGGGTTVSPPPTTNAISQGSGGGGTQSTTLAGLDVLAPKTFKIKKGRTKLALAITAQGPGSLAVALVKGAKILAKGGVNVTKAGTFGLNLKLPKKLVACACVLKVSWTPAGAPKAVTKTLKIKFIGGKAKKATAARIVPIRERIGGPPLPAMIPNGTPPVVPYSSGRVSGRYHGSLRSP
jgi:hypothetical protein